MKPEKQKSEKEIKTEKWNKLRELVEEFWVESAMEKLNKVYGK
jgi:hypothetical protein